MKFLSRQREPVWGGEVVSFFLDRYLFDTLPSNLTGSLLKRRLMGHHEGQGQKSYPTIYLGILSKPGIVDEQQVRQSARSFRSHTPIPEIGSDDEGLKDNEVKVEVDVEIGN